MIDRQPAAYKDSRDIIADAELLVGKLAVRGDYSLPHRALVEILRVAREVTN